jgi:electron transfer flavoprotein beta subunit
MKKARNTQIPVWNADDLKIDPERTGQNGSPTWVEKIFSPEQRTGGELIEGDSDEIAVRIVDLLFEMMAQ